MAWVFFVWYPPPLAHAESVTIIFLMLLDIDVILGLLLSLLVYKEGKKILKIGVLPWHYYLIYGIKLWSLCHYSVSPWIDCPNRGIFEVVPANVVDGKDQIKAESQYQSNSFTELKWFAVNDAKTPKIVWLHHS